MEQYHFPSNWFENRLNRSNLYRHSMFIDERATVNERIQLKDLLRTVNMRLSDVEKRVRILENENRRINISGSQTIELTSSFETLLFWFRLLEKNLAAFSRKVPIETEFSPRVKIVRKRIQILARKASSDHQ